MVSSRAASSALVLSEAAIASVTSTSAASKSLTICSACVSLFRVRSLKKLTKFKFDSLNLLLTGLDLSSLLAKLLLLVGDISLQTGQLSLNSREYPAHLDLLQLGILIILEIVHLFLQTFTIRQSNLLLLLGSVDDFFSFG
jgi:hypothetical protein